MGDRFQIREWELKRLSKMLLIRRFEERAFREYTMPRARVGGFLHLCNGQEAIAVGTSEVFRRGIDVYAGSFRSHGWSLALGMSPRAAMAELFGRATGCCGGKAGSMQLSDAATGNLGGWNVVASQMPVGAGAAFAAAYRKTGGVAFVVFSDGAVNQGVFAETLNLASLLKLPAVFILEDNGAWYSVETRSPAEGPGCQRMMGRAPKRPRQDAISMVESRAERIEAAAMDFWKHLAVRDWVIDSLVGWRIFS
jgi:pyruvate dehydrogenase E1 component alpha subunit